MSENPFAGLNESHNDRLERESRLRERKWRAFFYSLAAIGLTGLLTGVGGAAGGLIEGDDLESMLLRIASGVGFGVLIGTGSFLGALWGIMKQLAKENMFGGEEDFDVGAILYWRAVAGAAIGGVAGATVGFGQSGPLETGVACGAVIGAGLGLLTARRLHRALQNSERSGRRA